MIDLDTLELPRVGCCAYSRVLGLSWGVYLLEVLALSVFVSFVIFITVVIRYRVIHHGLVVFTS